MPEKEPIKSDKPKQQSKKHHYVPVFYMNRWCNEDGKIHTVKNINGKIIRNNHTPDHTGFEYHLYSYHEDMNSDNRAEMEEDYFKPIDNEGAKIVKKMIEGGDLEEGDIGLWAQFITTMRIRTPDNIARIKNEGQDALEKALVPAQKDYSEARNEHDPVDAGDWLQINRPGLKESVGLRQIPAIALNEQVIECFLSFNWHVVNFERSSKPLLTSDKPCVFTMGLDKSNCVIALPLSPHHAFFAFRSESEAQRSLMNSRISCLAAALNDSVVRQARREASILSEMHRCAGQFL